MRWLLQAIHAPIPDAVVRLELEADFLLNNFLSWHLVGRGFREGAD